MKKIENKEKKKSREISKKTNKKEKI